MACIAPAKRRIIASQQGANGFAGFGEKSSAALGKTMGPDSIRKYQEVR